MSAQTSIPQLPTAGPLTGSELSVVVQNGITVHTTTGAISVQPTQTQTFLTQTQEASLANSRYLSSGTGIALVDGGAGSFFRVSLTGAALSLQNAATGLLVKDTATTVASRAIAASGAGLSVSNADGVAGNPTVALSGLPASLANLTGAGFLVLRAGGTSINPRTITGTSGQIVVTNGDGQTTDPAIGLAATTVSAGAYGSQGKTLVQTVDAYGRLTANSEIPIFITNTQITGLGSMSVQAASAVAITGGSITGITDLAVADGGTGASTAANARVNLLPSYAGNAVKVLTVNAGATDVEWVAAGVGSVTNVSALTLGTTGTDLSSTVANGTTTPVITLNVPTASASNRGALSSTDWSTFNSKQPSGTYVNSVSGTAPVVSSGGVTPAISMAAATGSVNGYLTSTDWTTFNAKQPAGAYLTAVTSDTPLVGSGTAASHLSMPAATGSVNGYLSSADWSTFNAKQPAGTYVTAVSVVSANGLAGTATSGATPAITLTTSITGLLKGNATAISAASAGSDYVAPSAYASANGLTMATARLLGRTTALAGAAEEISVAGGLTLSAGTLTGTSGTVTSVAALTLGTTGTDLSSTVANGSTTPVITLQVPTASAANRGALSSTDWSTFNGKQDVFGSQTANYVYAAPNGSAGSPTFRALVATDIPSLSASYVPYTGASADVDLNNKHLVNINHLGVGTTASPDILIRAVGDNGALSRIAMRGYSSDANGSAIRVTKFRGNTGAPQVPQSGDSLGRFEFAGYATTSADGLTGAYWEGVTTELWGATAHGTKALLYVTPNTTITPAVAITVDQDKSVSLTGALSVTGHTTFEGVTSTGATGTAKLVYSTSPTLITPSLGVASATSLAVTGTAGAGFATFVGQSSNPTSPAAGTLLVHSKTVNGFTRLEQDNESATNVVYARDNVFIAENPTGSTIPKGSTVYVSGTVSGAPQVQLARANSSSTLPCVGITTDAILAGGFGQVMYAGLLTFDTTAFSAGNQVWVSTSTAGALTATRPSGTTNSAQRMGTILVSGNSTTGLMLVQTSPALLNMETGTNAATWSGTNISLTGTLVAGGGVDKLTTATGVVSVAAATAPTTGQILTATSATTATWQGISGGTF